MLIDFVSTIAAAFAAGGCFLIVNRLTGRRLPRWMLPASAGAAMIAFASWAEYSWYDRVSAELPDYVTIVEPLEERSGLRPWTLIVPPVTAIRAVDGSATITSTADPALKVTQIYEFRRWANPIKAAAAFDCAGGRRGDIPPGREASVLTADGRIEGVDWVPVPPEDGYLRAACDGG